MSKRVSRVMRAMTVAGQTGRVVSVMVLPLDRCVLVVKSLAS